MLGCLKFIYEVSNQIAVNQTVHGQIMTSIKKSSCVQWENTITINLNGFFFFWHCLIS